MICIIDCGTMWLENIKENLTDLDQSFKVIDIDNIKNCNFNQFSGIIITGSPILLTKVDKQNYINLFNFIKTTNTPILGICFGHQIIGLTHGAKIEIGDMVKKKEQIEVVNQNGLFSGINNNSFFQEAHCEFIDLPNDFKLLAKSKSCTNEAMKHKSKNIYCVQFHPEVSSECGKQIFINFLQNM